MNALVALVAVYSATGLAIALITLYRYARERGGLDALSVLLAVREIVGEALSFIWFLLLFHMWGFLDLTALGWSATLPPPLAEPRGQLLFLGLALLLALYYALYLNGRIWKAFFTALAGVLVLQLAFHLLDFYFLAFLLAIGIAVTLAAAAAIFSELRTSL